MHFLFNQSKDFQLFALFGQFVDIVIGQLVGYLLGASLEYFVDICLETIDDSADLAFALQLLLGFVEFHI